MSQRNCHHCREPIVAGMNFVNFPGRWIGRNLSFDLCETCYTDDTIRRSFMPVRLDQLSNREQRATKIKRGEMAHVGDGMDDMIDRIKQQQAAGDEQPDHRMAATGEREDDENRRLAEGDLVDADGDNPEPVDNRNQHVAGVVTDRPDDDLPF